MAFVYINSELTQSNREKIRSGAGIWGQIREELRFCGNKHMNEGPWAVTDWPSKAISGNPHDFYSEAPYWWPDKDPSAPYIRRDGELNPERFDKHLAAFKKLGMTSCMLAITGYYLEDKRYFERLALVLDRWFLNPETKMNPHLDYGEAIINICPGRNAGIITLVSLNRIVHGLGFLATSSGYEKLIEGMKDWLRQMIHWLKTSNNGIAERKTGNNHTSWWNTHIATAAAFCGDEETFSGCVEFFKEELLPKQVEQSGEMPRETSRTRSLHYSLFNTEALSLMCEAAWQKGIDLWNWKTQQGVGMLEICRYLLPYLENPFTWPHPQITGDIIDDQIVLHFAALRMGMKECIKVNNKLRRGRYLIREQTPIGPLALLEGFEEQYSTAIDPWV